MVTTFTYRPSLVKIDARNLARSVKFQLHRGMSVHKWQMHKKRLLKQLCKLSIHFEVLSLNQIKNVKAALRKVDNSN